MLNDTFEPNWRSDKVSGSPRGMKGLSFLAKNKGNPNCFSGVPQDWIDFAIELKNGLKDPRWELVSAPGYNRGNVDNIKRGDILAREFDVNKPKKDQHGHMMIAMGEPNNGRLKIADSTSKPNHTNDTRKIGDGMGKGEIKVKDNKMAWSVNGDPNLRIWVVRLKH